MQGLNYGIDMGSRIAIVGPNGAGKTTLMNLLAGDDRLFMPSGPMSQDASGGLTASDAAWLGLKGAGCICRQSALQSCSSDFPPLRLGVSWILGHRLCVGIPVRCSSAASCGITWAHCRPKTPAMPMQPQSWTLDPVYCAIAAVKPSTKGTSVCHRLCDLTQCSALPESDYQSACRRPAAHVRRLPQGPQPANRTLCPALCGRPADGREPCGVPAQQVPHGAHKSQPLGFDTGIHLLVTSLFSACTMPRLLCSLPLVSLEAAEGGSA